MRRAWMGHEEATIRPDKWWERVRRRVRLPPGGKKKKCIRDGEPSRIAPLRPSGGTCYAVTVIQCSRHNDTPLYQSDER